MKLEATLREYKKKRTLYTIALIGRERYPIRCDHLYGPGYIGDVEKHFNMANVVLEILNDDNQKALFDCYVDTFAELRYRRQIYQNHFKASERFLGTFLALMPPERVERFCQSRYPEDKDAGLKTYMQLLLPILIAVAAAQDEIRPLKACNQSWALAYNMFADKVSPLMSVFPRYDELLNGIESAIQIDSDACIGATLSGVPLHHQYIHFMMLMSLQDYDDYIGHAKTFYQELERPLQGRSPTTAFRHSELSRRSSGRRGGSSDDSDVTTAAVATGTWLSSGNNDSSRSSSGGSSSNDND